MRLNCRPPLYRMLLASGLSVAMPISFGLDVAGMAQAQAQSGSSQGMKLLKLTVTGNRQVPTATIEQAMTVSVGQKVTRADLAANFNAIVDVYRHANVGAGFKQKMTIPRPGQVRVEYMIEEQAPLPPQAPAVLRLDQVRFEGNKKVSSDTIRSAITLKPGDVVNNDGVVASMNAILAQYKKANVGVKITPSASYPQPNHAVVDYSIVESGGS